MCACGCGSCGKSPSQTVMDEMSAAAGGLTPDVAVMGQGEESGEAMPDSEMGPGEGGYGDPGGDPRMAGMMGGMPPVPSDPSMDEQDMLGLDLEQARLGGMMNATRKATY